MATGARSSESIFPREPPASPCGQCFPSSARACACMGHHPCAEFSLVRVQISRRIRRAIGRLRRKSCYSIARRIALSKASSSPHATAVTASSSNCPNSDDGLSYPKTVSPFSQVKHSKFRQRLRRAPAPLLAQFPGRKGIASLQFAVLWHSSFTRAPRLP